MSRRNKWVVIGHAQRMNISGFKHLLPLYRKAINNINTDENKRMFEQIAAREGIENVDEFIDKMHNDSEYRNAILGKYKI